MHTDCAEDGKPITIMVGDFQRDPSGTSRQFMMAKTQLLLFDVAALRYLLANPCIVQWNMLWFSAPTNLNHGFLNTGVILEKYNEVWLFVRRSPCLSAGCIHREFAPYCPDHQREPGM